MHFQKNTLFLWKSVSANLIYLEKYQITEYWKNRPNNLDFLPIQNVRQYHFHDVAKYEKISPKESDIKEFGQNEEYLCLSSDEMLPWQRR